MNQPAFDPGDGGDRPREPCRHTTDPAPAAEALQRRTNEFAALYDISCSLAEPQDVAALLAQLAITEHKRMQQVLAESQRQYRELMATLDGIVWEADALTFQFLFVSDKAERLLGYPLQQWVDDPNFWVEHLHPEDREWAPEFCIRETRQLRDHVFEYRMVARDGRIIWLRDYVTVVLENGRVTKLRGVMVDITDRKQAEQAQRQAEENYRSIFEHAIEGIYQTTPAGRFLTANPAAARMLGYDSPEQLITQVQDIGKELYLDPSRRVQLRHQLERDGVVRGFECEARRRDGSTIWVIQHARAVRDAAGTVQYYEGTAVDITAQKRAEDALRLSEERYRQMAETIGCVFWMSDPVQRSMLYISPAYEAVWGRSCQSLYDDPISWLDAIHPADRQRATAAYAQQLQGQITEVEYRVVRPDGSVRWIQDRGFPIRDGAGRVCRIVGVADDISADKRAERMLRRQRKRLSALAAQLANAQESERRRVALELHDLVSQNLSAVAMNLTIVTNQMAAHAAASECVPRLNDSLRLIHEVVGHVRTVMSELRPPVLDDCGLLDALQWYGDDFATRTGVAFRLTGVEPAPRLGGDVEIALFRIFQEAISNVAKHAQATQVSASLGPQLTGGVQLTVHDDGRGFEPARAGRPRHRSGYGLLGMRERAQAVSGRLTIESAPGQGTRIQVLVPHAARPATP